MTSDQVFTAVVTAIASGAVSSVSAVVALRVHVHWLERSLTELKASLGRAHQRIDDLQRVSKNS